MKFPLPCFVCGRELCSATRPPEESADLSTPPSGGLYFTSSGNFGSTLWDPCSWADGAPLFYLEINICDGCVKERQDRVVTVCQVTKHDVVRTPREGIVDPDDWEGM